MCVCVGGGVNSSQSLIQSSSVLGSPPPFPQQLVERHQQLQSTARVLALSCPSLQLTFLKLVVYCCSATKWETRTHTLTVVHTHTHPTHMMGERGDGEGEGTRGGGWGCKKKRSEKRRKQTTITRTLVLFERCPSSP